MGSCKKHDGHDHKHGSTCGHQAVQHDDHTDYLHDGHLHHMHEDHVDEHVLGGSGANNIACTPEHACGNHENTHTHGATCGHSAVPHADHVDYLVGGHLHHPCENHCDHHGQVSFA